MNAQQSVEKDAPCANPVCGHSKARHCNLGCLVERGNSGSGSVADAVFCRCISYVTPPEADLCHEFIETGDCDHTDAEHDAMQTRVLPPGADQ